MMISFTTMPLIDPGRKAPAFSLKDQARQDAPARRLRGPAGRPLLLSERRHAGLHQGSVRVSRQPAEVQDQQGRRPRREHPRRSQQGEFAGKYELTFPLLADENHEVAEKYGVWQKRPLYGRTSWAWRERPI